MSNCGLKRVCDLFVGGENNNKVQETPDTPKVVKGASSKIPGQAGLHKSTLPLTHLERRKKGFQALDIRRVLVDL